MPRKHKMPRRDFVKTAAAGLGGIALTPAASYARIRDLGARLIKAQEAERARIARELHDDIIQQVALLGINIELITGSGDDVKGDADQFGREAMDRVRRIARSIRALSHQLHPSRLRLTGWSRRSPASAASCRVRPSPSRSHMRMCRGKSLTI